MDGNILGALDPRELGRRLQGARKARGQTQQEAAVHLGVARTTITAIEKGERRIRPQELVRLALFYGRSVGEFLRQGTPATPFTVQLRAVLAPGMEVEKDISSGLAEFERLCVDYLELERICEAPLGEKYPESYRTEGVTPEAAGEDVASAERNRLGLGDGPLLNLREVLENDVGLRIFYIALPSRIAEMFAYTEDLGGCLAINRKHPAERGRMSLAHGYAHFLTNRYRPEVAFLGRYQRVPEQERFADAFARSFLMPESGMRRRFNELKRRRQGKFTPSDLCTLAHFYFVSVEALTLRLEELRLLPGGTWDRLQEAGFKVQEAKGLLHLRPYSANNQELPLRYMYLAAEAFERAELTEGQLARFLRTDRLEARRIVVELASGRVVSDEGAVSTVPIDLGGSLSA
ncbi:MAG: XRE family transcriptional regulator [Dehalococcoidales bacterium]|nr:XRE family transcriptional regulator [Dehalococcoidales bacterium]